MNDFTAKNILITGASSGIGKSCTLECNKQGANVHLIGRDSQRLEEIHGMLKGDGNSYHAFDLRGTANYPEMISEIVSEHGKIDGFIHSAGYQIVSPLQAITPDQLMDIMNVNVISAIELSRIITQKKHCSTHGLSIVFIASVMSVVACAGLTAYCTSKAALVGAAKAMAIELAPKKVRVNCVSPGTVNDTAMTNNLKSHLSDSEYQRIVDEYPLGLGLTKDIAKACIYLLSDAAGWVTGHNLIVDGGYSAH